MEFVAAISRNIIAPLWAAWERSPYLRQYRLLLRTQYDPPAIVRARQEVALHQIMDHAWRTVPFWRERFASCGLHPRELITLDNLSRLPLLTKADIRHHGDALVSSEYPKAELHRRSTSGSTGMSLVTYHDDRCQQLQRAATLRSDEWTGWRLGERIAAVWGNPQIHSDWKGRLRRALLDRHYAYLDTLKMDEAAMDAFVDTMLEVPPSMLYGHAHSLYLLASFVDARRPDASIRPKAILSTCMVLHDFERAKIEETFACRVTNRYGCEEVSLIACECERHEGLHVNSDCLYLEIIDDRGAACPPGQPGRVIVTDLTNRAMPLLRYEVGDMATWANAPCSCGRTLPLLERIEGRVADYVVTSSGEYVSGISLTENFAVQIPGVAQLQIIQEELDRFTFNIVRAPDFSEASLGKLTELVAHRFGPATRYECSFVERIPQEKSGKYRFCISRVEKVFA